MRYPTRRVLAVNSVTVTISPARTMLARGLAAAWIFASISLTSPVLAGPMPPPGHRSASALTPIHLGSAAEASPPEARPPELVAPRPAGSSPSAAGGGVTNLDGLILWLGPWGARTEAPSGADSCVGVELAVTRIREAEGLGAAGISLGAARYAASDAGRLWANAMIGTRLGTRRGLGTMTGISAGPIVELSPVARPRLGASAGLWIFLGVTPFVRLAALEGRGVFGELGVVIALPVARWAK